MCPERYVWATVEAQPVVEHLLLQVPQRGTTARPRSYTGTALLSFDTLPAAASQV